MTHVALSRLKSLDNCAFQDHEFERLKKCRWKDVNERIAEEKRLQQLQEATIKKLKNVESMDEDEHDDEKVTSNAVTEQMDVVNSDEFLMQCMDDLETTEPMSQDELDEQIQEVSDSSQFFPRSGAQFEMDVADDYEMQQLTEIIEEQKKKQIIFNKQFTDDMNTYRLTDEEEWEQHQDDWNGEE